MENIPKQCVHYTRAPRVSVGIRMLLAWGISMWVAAAYADTAPNVVFYAGMEGDCCGEDPHPVHGHPTPDGGYVVGGKSIDSGQAWQGFAVKIGPEPFSGTVRLGQEQPQTYRWAVTFGSDGLNDAVNAVAPVGDAVFLGGLKTEPSGVAKGYLAKHDLQTGQLLWSMVLPANADGTSRAIEVLEPAADGGLYIGGLTDAAPEALEGFKSYGNPTDGVAQVMYFDAGSLASADAPAGPTWTTTFDGLTTVKGVRAVPAPEAGTIVLAHHEDKEPTLLRLTSAGDITWKQEYPELGEPTDITVVQSGGSVVGFAFTGHGGTNESLDGFAVKVSPSGEFMWKAVVGDPIGGVGQFAGLGPGNPKLIFDECWSIAQAPGGGVVLGCGTGIEGCDLWPSGSDIRAECDADPRKTWRSLITRLDSDGAVVWQRTDSFQPPEEGEVASSACEFVARTADGGWMSVVDEAFGIGIMVIAPEGAPDFTDGPSNAPEDTTPGTDGTESDASRVDDERNAEASRDDRPFETSEADGTSDSERPPRRTTVSDVADSDERLTIVGTPGCSSVDTSGGKHPYAGLLLLAACCGLMVLRQRSTLPPQ